MLTIFKLYHLSTFNLLLILENTDCGTLRTKGGKNGKKIVIDRIISYFINWMC